MNLEIFFLTHILPVIIIILELQIVPNLPGGSPFKLAALPCLFWHDPISF